MSTTRPAIESGSGERPGGTLIISASTETGSTVVIWNSSGATSTTPSGVETVNRNPEAVGTATTAGAVWK